MNDWLLEIKSLLLGVKGRGFLLRPHFGASPVRSGFPPAHPSARLGRAGFIGGFDFASHKLLTFVLTWLFLYFMIRYIS